MASGFHFSNIFLLAFFSVFIISAAAKPMGLMDLETNFLPMPEPNVIKILPRVLYACNEGDTSYWKLCKIDGTDCCESRSCHFKPDFVFLPYGSGSCSCVCNNPTWDERDIDSFRTLEQ